MSRPEQDKGENVTRLRPILFQNKLNWVETQGQRKISEIFQFFSTVILMCFELQNNQVSFKKNCFDKENRQIKLGFFTLLLILTKLLLYLKAVIVQK